MAQGIRSGMDVWRESSKGRVELLAKMTPTIEKGKPLNCQAYI